MNVSLLSTLDAPAPGWLLATPEPEDRSPLVAYLHRQTSPQSKRTMARCLRTLAELLAGQQAVDPARVAWWQLDDATASRLRDALLSRPLASGTLRKPATINKHLSALRGVLKVCWLMDRMEGELYRRVATELQGVTGDTLPVGRHVEDGELRRLFEACDGTTVVGTRDAAMLSLLYGCGLRRHEVVGLDLEDVDATSGEVAVRVAKGRRERRAYLPAGGRAAMAAWLLVRGDAPGPLLVRLVKGGGFAQPAVGITSQALYARCVVLGEAAQVRFSPHDLRRTAVTNLLDRGEDLSIVRQVVGHRSVVTTARYDRRGEVAKRRAVEKLHVPFSV